MQYVTGIHALIVASPTLHTCSLQLFHSQDVSLAELSVMEDKDLDKLGVPLGPRIRILQELKKLRPVDNSDII